MQTLYCSAPPHALPPTQIDTQTITRVFLLPTLVECGDIQGAQTECAKLWNATHCVTDSDYYQISPENQRLDLIFNLPDAVNNWATGGQFGWQLSDTIGTNWLLKLDLLDGCCQPVEGVFGGSLITDSWVGANEDLTQFWQAVRIDTSLITSDKFQFAVTINTGGGNSQTYITEPYRRVCCNETPVYIRGLQANGVDCAGIWRGSEPPANIFGLYFDAYDEHYFIGAVEMDAFPIEKESVNDTPTSVRLESGFSARLDFIPPYLAEKLAYTLTAPSIKVNDIDALYEGTVERNNETGEMFFPVLEFTKVLCDKDFKC